MSWPVLIARRNSSSVPGAWRCTGRNNEEMVDKLVHMGVITSKEVEEAFRAVPRGAFVAPDLQVEAYIDAPLVGDHHLHMSAPHMYATVMEALDLSPGRKSFLLLCRSCKWRLELYVSMLWLNWGHCVDVPYIMQGNCCFPLSVSSILSVLMSLISLSVISI